MHTHTHTHTQFTVLFRPSIRPSCSVFIKQNIKGKLKVGKLFFLKEHSESFKSFFYVIGFEVISYHLITHSIKPHFFHGFTATSVSRPHHRWGITITLRPTTFHRSPLEEWSAHRKNLYLTNFNRHKREREREISMTPAGFEPVIPTSERPKIHYLDGAATVIG